jgi:IclR family acetate operon transcriptional repressor
MATNGSITTIQSVARAADILETLAAARHGLALADIAEKLGLNESTVHHLLGTLKQRGFVEQEPTTKIYRLGYRLIGLVNGYLSNIDMYAMGHDAIRALRDLSGEMTYLSAVRNGHVLNMLQMVGWNPIQVQRYSRPGMTTLHSTASGKVYLASLDPAQARAILTAGPLTPFTPNTLTTVAALDAELATTRQRGYALDREEDWLGIMCIAAPIHNHLGDYAGSASISFARADEKRVAELIPMVVESARSISRNLGYVQPMHLDRSNNCP